MVISEAGMLAVSCVAETKVVVRAVPLKLTLEPAMNPVPFTVRVKAGSPAVAELGLRLLMVGAGLGAAVVVKVVVAGEEVVPSAQLLTMLTV